MCLCALCLLRISPVDELSSGRTLSHQLNDVGEAFFLYGLFDTLFLKKETTKRTKELYPRLSFDLTKEEYNFLSPAIFFIFFKKEERKKCFF